MLFGVKYWPKKVVWPIFGRKLNFLMIFAELEDGCPPRLTPKDLTLMRTLRCPTPIPAHLIRSHLNMLDLTYVFIIHLYSNKCLEIMNDYLFRFFRRAADKSLPYKIPHYKCLGLCPSGLPPPVPTVVPTRTPKTWSPS